MAYRYYIDEYRRERGGTWIQVLLVGAVAGAMVVGLAWAGTWWFTRADAQPPRPPAASPPATDEPLEATTDAGGIPHQLDRCRSVYDAQRAPLRTVAGSLAQWEVHIGAMNELVVGAITLPQARQFWNRTRAGARAKLRRFDTAHDVYAQRVYRCPKPVEGTRPALRRCHRAVAARERTVRLATTALGTWERHVHHMEMLRRGEMTAQQATRLWLQSWRAGDREVRAYRGAARAGRGLTC
jgi:hypothetical protein